MTTPRLPHRLRTGHADLEYLVLGSGAPVTVFAHGLAGSVHELHGMAGGVRGTRVLFNFRGHGNSRCRPEDINGYAGLADDLAAMADHTGARQVFGLSMGASAAVRVLAAQPDRFDRAVLLRPTTLDVPLDERVQAEARTVAAASERGDRAVLRHFLAQRIPAARRGSRSIAELIDLRVEVLAGPGGRATVAAVAQSTPRTTPAQLSRVRTAALVMGSLGDPLHPESTAQRIAAALPRSSLHICRGHGAAWHQRTHIRDFAVRFLNATDGARAAA